MNEKVLCDEAREKIMIKSPRWGFAFFKNSIYFHYNLVFMIDLIIALFLTSSFGLMVFEQSNLETTYCKLKFY